MSVPKEHSLLLMSKEHSLVTRPIVYLQSLFVIGTFFWVPYLLHHIMKKYKTTRQRALSLLTFIFIVLQPVKKSNFVQNLFVWDHYARYFKTKIIGIPFSRKQTVFGIIPHGIVPLTLGNFFHNFPIFYSFHVIFVFINNFIITFTVFYFLIFFSHYLFFSLFFSFFFIIFFAFSLFFIFIFIFRICSIW